VGDAVLRYLEEVVFKTTVSPEEVAAIVVESIQGEGGYIVPPPDFLSGLQEVARKHGILILADEVQSGMGRTGRMFAFEHFKDFHPDIVALAKGIASGMPLGVTIARSKLMTWGPGAHASTFGGNPVCLAAALATVGLLESEYVSNAARIGVYLKSSLLQLTNAHPAIGDVRGVGLMLGIEIVKDRGSKAHDPNLRNAIVSECFNRGLLVLGAGASTIRLSPPLLIDEEQADCAVRILSDAISAATI
jgi:4-aminobutyrate aminotransferase